jgi:DNA-binding MarR family transcriptional regulator
MVENVNRVLERQMRHKSEIHLLRKILIEEDWIMTICTSPTYLNAVTQPEQPLFEFFDVKLLAELTPEQQEQMLQKLAALEGNVAFENDLAKYRSQLRALYHFTGGNPRLTIMLYDLVANQSITDVKTELDLLLNQLTPFYQDRMKEVAEQEGKILETMALLPEGCTPTELAKEARMPGEHVRALLTRLEKAGYIRREERRRKRTIYIIPERFFRIWHQMNHSRAARGRVQYLLEFFASWYATNEEREQVPEKPAQDLNQVLATLIEELTDEQQDHVEASIRAVLRSAFRSANLEIIRNTITTIVAAKFSDTEAFYAPYVAALEYIQSDKNPAVLERQHPEMRDAIQLLVNIFDEGSTQLQRPKQKKL